ncbi:MAG: type II toxin-antitoxin system prevent-host-death family antitoxin [Chloroflexi bacterium]|nr:MAG: type II toxin-antitoxin system prevent-host-death family antitoxin [Chloroflexota bacterium]
MQTRTIEVQEAQASLDELLALVREGVEILLTEGGTPLARLTPVETGRRIPDLHPGAWISDDFDDGLPDEFWLGEERNCICK